MFTIPQPNNPQEEQSSPELKFKDTLDTITPILSKSPPDRTEQELRRLTIFLTRFSPFSSFWNTLSQDLQPYLLREFRYIEVKPNKSVFFLGGPIQCIYFLLKGSVCAFKTPSLEEKLRNDRASFPSYVKRRENVLKRPMTASISPCNSFSPAKHTVALKTEDIMAQNPDHQYIGELKEGEGFGELVSDTFNPKKNALITKETCQFLVLSATAYKRIQSGLNKYLQSQTTGLLRKLALLKDWNTGDLSDLFLHTNSVNLGRNHVLYNIGDSCDHVYIVQDGEVEIIKEMTLDLEDEEIFDKRSIVKQSKDIDRSRLVELNPKWKKKFTMARKQQIRVALLGSGQSFGEEEFTQGPLPTARYTKAVVKSLTAKILMVPVDKIFKNVEVEAAPAVIRSFTQPLSISEALVTEAEAPKINVSINPEAQEDDSKHRKSVSIGTLAHKFQKSLAISNDTLLVNRLAMLNNFGITYENQPAPEDNKENIEQNSRKKSFVCKSPKNETIPTSKSPIRIAGIKRLWESNVQAYYPKGKKPDQAKNSPQVDRKIKYSFTAAPEKPASLNNIGITTLTTRYVSQPFIMNTFGVTATKSFRAFSPAEQLTTSLGHQTLLGESKEMDDETLKNNNNFSHKKRESKIVFKKRSDVTGSRKTSIHLMKGLSKVMSPVNGFKEKSVDLNKVTFGETITSRNIAKSRTQVVTMQMNTPY